MTMPSSGAVGESEQATARLRTGLWHLVLNRILDAATRGSLLVIDPSGREIVAKGGEPGVDAEMKIRSWRTLRRLLTAGHVGFGEAYIAGDFESPDLCALLTWAMQNEYAVARVWQGSWPSHVGRVLAHFANRNSLRGSRRNIEAHYDLGNDFYAVWLDRGMQYSSALYGAPDQSLEAAQAAKLDRILALLEASPADKVLEIGCGWGALAERLAGDVRCEVTGLTLSNEQLAYARNRVASLRPRPDLHLADYRTINGQFDRIVSIEMIEAVGEAYWPTYFATLRRNLKAGGRAVIQAITVDERTFESYRQSPDFIQKHIFPGGMLPTVGAIRRNAAASGLKLMAFEQFGASYALTLAEWRRRFHSALGDLRLLGFDDAFFRKWDYYLAYCETGFQVGTLDVGFFVLAN